MSKTRTQHWDRLRAPEISPVIPGTMCECGQMAIVAVSAPLDTGPFSSTAIEEVVENDPRHNRSTWDCPACAVCMQLMTALVQCHGCNIVQYGVDTIGNGSTVTLCRACNADENA